jgi:acetyl esterase/lipase
VLKPKSLESKSAPVYIYAHGGGGLVQDAESSVPQMAISCVNLNCVIISVDYRKGPEVKCPTGHNDFVEAVLHVLDNPEKFGIDPKKACMAGISGGGWIVAGATNVLVTKKKIHRIKALFIHTGMLSDEC